MKKILLALLCALFAQLLTAQTLTQAPGGPQGGSVYCLEEVGNDLWIGTSNGIYISQDEAVTWNPLPLDSPMIVIDLLAWGDTVLMSAMGIQEGVKTGGVWRSTNHGQTWIPAFTFPSSSGAWLTFTESQGIVVYGFGLDGVAQISYDTGQTWQPHSPPYPIGIGSYTYQSLYTSDSLATITWNTDSMWYFSISHDAFATWEIEDSLPTTFMYLGEIYQDSVVCLMIYDPLVNGSVFHRSFDYGRSWDTVVVAQNFTQLIHEPGADTVYTYDVFSHNLFYSSDYCATWHPHPSASLRLVDERYNINNNIIRNGKIFYLYDDWSMDRGVGVKDRATGFCYTNLSGIRAFTSATPTLVGGTLYITDGVRILRSDDGAQNWQVKVPAAGMLSTTPIHIRTVPGRPDSMVCWEPGFGRYLWSDSLQSMIPEYSSHSQIDIDGFADITDEVIYSSYDNIYSFNLVNWQEKKITLPGVNSMNRVYKVRSLQDSLLFALTSQGIISGSLKDSAWMVSPMTISNISIDLTGDLSMPSLPTFLSPNDTTMALVNYGSILITHDGGQTWIPKAGNGLPVPQFGPKQMPIMSAVWQGQWLGYVPDKGLYLSTDEGANWQFVQKLPFQCTGMKAVGNMVFFTSRNAGTWWFGGQPSLLSGTVYWDQDGDQIRDAGEPPLKAVKVATDMMGNVTTSNANGGYALLTLMAGDTARLLAPVHTTASPANVVTTGQTQAQDWAISFAQQVADLSGDATAASVFRPGFSTPMTLSCENVGNVAQSATLSLQLDPYVTFVSASVPPVITGSTLTWATPTLGYQDLFQVTVVVATPAIVPPTQDSISLSWNISTAAGDVTPSNNAGYIHEPIRMSYDPNDKACNFGDRIPVAAADSGEALIYTIRFQNKGTYQADKVVVADTLDHQFDPATITVLSSSHAMQLEQQGAALRFVFDPIVLPAEQDDEPGSHGFVKYSVRLREGATPGMGVSNTAFIYFDFNPAIVTNTVSTRVVFPGDTVHLSPLAVAPRGETAPHLWEMFPNPARETLFVRPVGTAGRECAFSMFDLTGRRIVDQQPLNAAQATAIDIRSLPGGWYFCQVQDSSGQVVGTGKIYVE